MHQHTNTAKSCTGILNLATVYKLSGRRSRERINLGTNAAYQNCRIPNNASNEMSDIARSLQQLRRKFTVSLAESYESVLNLFTRCCLKISEDAEFF